MWDSISWENWIDLVLDVGAVLVVTVGVTVLTVRTNRRDPRRQAVSRLMPQPDPGPLPPMPQPQPEPPSPIPRPPNPEPAPPNPPIPVGHS